MSAAAADFSLQLCALRVGDQEFVLDLMRVEEVLRPVPITPLPRTPPFVEGVAQIRGTLVPVVDLRTCLGLARPATPGPRERLMVCRLGRRRVAVRVDAALEVMNVSRADLRPAPPLATAGGRPFVVGAVGPPGRLRLLLDLKVLLRRPQAGG